MTNRNLYGWFDDTNGAGVTGVSGSVDVYQMPHITGSATLIVSSGAFTEVGGGLYKYLVTGFDFITNDALVIFKTLSSSVSKKQVPALRWDAAEAHGTGTFGSPSVIDMDTQLTNTHGTGSWGNPITVAQVDTQLSNSHGTGSWNTVAPTVTQIDTQLSNSHSTGTWGGIFSAPTVQQIDAQLSNSHSTGSWSTTTNVPTVGQIDTQLSNTHGAGLWGGSGGTGAIDWSNNFIVTVSGLPRDGVYCRFTTDVGGVNIVASGITNSFGKLASLMLDAGTYYVWLQLSGVDFSPLPKIEVVI